MKKCPECGNPSYDGAPVCGNCGYVFPKPKVSAPKGKDIFEKDSKAKKSSDTESTVNIIKDHKLLIGAIILITVIVICGIVLTSGSNQTSTPIQTSALNEYNENGFSFSYPQDWKEVNYTDSDHEDAIYLEKGDVILEYYNVTSDYSNLKEVTLDRIDHAQNNGAYVELVETITLDSRNGSNIVFENADGDYTRYVSLLGDGELYVFRVMGDSFNSVTSSDVDSIINTAHVA
ncbi:MAG: zinc ribbon domain-containing protein [Methanobrevibacter sp.]|nr:zinc ribbon domain-containing protein [Methanobrevibacter sp.]